MGIADILEFLTEAKSVYDQLETDGVLAKFKDDAASVETELQNPKIQAFLVKVEAFFKKGVAPTS
jgi:hypothetical protein